LYLNLWISVVAGHTKWKGMQKGEWVAKHCDIKNKRGGGGGWDGQSKGQSHLEVTTSNLTLLDHSREEQHWHDSSPNGHGRF
jgi:hypothetical protein